MRRIISLCVIAGLAGCEMPAEYEGTLDESGSELTPRTTFVRTIPSAPAAVPTVTWTPGMSLVPAGYTPQSFWVVYAGKEGTTDRVEAAGFDVVARTALFSVELATSEVDSFSDEVFGSITLMGLQAQGYGIAGNVTPKCCKLPGTDFRSYAWGTAFVQAEAYAALYR